MRWCWQTLGGAAILLVSGCMEQPAEAPPRSGAYDYPPPPSQTANGQVVGADEMSPQDKLASGPRVGSEGFLPAGRPAGPEQKKKPQPPSSSSQSAQQPCAQGGVTANGTPAPPCKTQGQ